MLQKVLIVGTNNGLSEMLIALAQQKQCIVECFDSNIKYAPKELYNLLYDKKPDFIIITGGLENALNLKLMIEAVRVFRIPFGIIFTKGKIYEGWYNEHALWSLEVTDEMKDNNIVLYQALKEVFALPAFVTT